jgi:hypothetical protein
MGGHTHDGFFRDQDRKKLHGLPSQKLRLFSLCFALLMRAEAGGPLKSFRKMVLPERIEVQPWRP